MRYASFIGGSWNAKKELLNTPAPFIDKRTPEGMIERYEKFAPVGRFTGVMALRSSEQVTYVISTMTREGLVDAVRQLPQPLFVDDSTPLSA